MSHDTTGTEPDDSRLTARLRELERENAVLRDQAALASAAPQQATAARRTHGVRSTGAVLLIIVGVLLAPVAVVAHWAQQELTDTDRYVATIAPLASDPVVQSAVSDRLTTVVMEQLDVSTLVSDALTALNSPDLPPTVALALGAAEQPLTDGIESFVHKTATAVVESPTFEDAWVEANRLAHTQLVAVMEGDSGNVLQVGDDGQLTIELAGVIETLKGRLVDEGFAVAANIPEVNATFTIVETSQLVTAQNAYGAIDVIGTWLPWISLALIAAGVLTAVHRARALVVAGLALAVSMLVLGIGLYVARTLYLDALAGTVERLDAAEIVFDQLVAFIRAALRTVAVLGLVLAAARSEERRVGKECPV